MKQSIQAASIVSVETVIAVFQCRIIPTVFTVSCKHSGQGKIVRTWVLNITKVIDHWVLNNTTVIDTVVTPIVKQQEGYLQ